MCSWQHVLLQKQCSDQHFVLKLGVSMPAHAASLIVLQHAPLDGCRVMGKELVLQRFGACQGFIASILTPRTNSRT